MLYHLEKLSSENKLKFFGTCFIFELNNLTVKVVQVILHFLVCFIFSLVILNVHWRKGTTHIFEI